MTTDDLYQKLLLKASAYAARSEHSPKEVEQKLYAWGGEELSPELVRRVLEALLQDGFIDPARYAAAYARDKALLLHKGPRLIRRELYEKGITDRAAIDAALAGVEEEEWQASLAAYLAPKLRQYRPKAKNGYDLSRRLYAAASGRGFEERQIRAWMETARLESEEEDEA